MRSVHLLVGISRGLYPSDYFIYHQNQTLLLLPSILLLLLLLPILLLLHLVFLPFLSLFFSYQGLGWIYLLRSVKSVHISIAFLRDIFPLGLVEGSCFGNRSSNILPRWLVQLFRCSSTLNFNTLICSSIRMTPLWIWSCRVHPFTYLMNLISDVWILLRSDHNGDGHDTIEFKLSLFSSFPSQIVLNRTRNTVKFCNSICY